MATKDRHREHSVFPSLWTPPSAAPLSEPAPAPLAVVSPGGSATGAANVLAHYADDSATLNPEATSKAIRWAHHQHFTKEKLGVLQAAVGAPATGEYDAVTAQAVALAQRQHGLSSDGQAGHQTRQLLGLEGKAVKGAADQHPKAAPEHQPPQEGVSVALFTQFNTAKTGKGDLEFERRADDYAKQYQAAGLCEGALAWNKSTPFKELSGLTTAVQGIHSALVAYVAQSKSTSPIKEPTSQKTPGESGADELRSTENVVASPPPALASGPDPSNVAEGGAKPDHSTQIKHLAIFTHGMEYGIDTNPNVHTYKDGLHKDHKGLAHSNIAAYVKNVSSALAPDVSVQLYACSTGREADQDDGSRPGGELAMPETGERRGSDSFAAHLAAELHEQGHPEASVYAHINAKHTTENPYARVFGHEAGEERGGKPLFDLLYPAEFTTEELLKLVPDLLTQPPAAQEQLQTRMRALMWAHYIDCVLSEHHRRNHHDEMVFDRRTYTGMEMFQNPAATATKLKVDFQSRWLTAPRQSEILRPTPAPKAHGFKE